MHIEPYVPQRLLLSRCDLFITHGGFNSTKEALSLGVPLVVIPIGGDQFYCAERCASLGVAQVIEPDNRSPESIAHAAATVLGDPRYRTSAAEFQSEMAALSMSFWSNSLRDCRIAKIRVLIGQLGNALIAARSCSRDSSSNGS